MAAALPQSESFKREQGRSHKVFYDLASEVILSHCPQYPTGYTGQPYSVWEGLPQGTPTRTGEVLEVILEVGYHEGGVAWGASILFMYIFGF